MVSQDLFLWSLMTFLPYAISFDIFMGFLAIHTFLSVILWGTPLSFDWNLLPSGFSSFLSLLFYEFIIAYKNNLSTYFCKKI